MLEIYPALKLTQVRKAQSTSDSEASHRVNSHPQESPGNKYKASNHNSLSNADVPRLILFCIYPASITEQPEAIYRLPLLILTGGIHC